MKGHFQRGENNVAICRGRGSAGALSRVLLAQWLNKRSFPAGTWMANITGSILLGFLAAAYGKGTLSDIWWSLLGIGFCGSFTTFSSFGVETVHMIQQHQLLKALIYVLTSASISLTFVALIFFCFHH